MRHTTFALALITAAALSACGGVDTGSKAGDQSLKTKFSAQVTFGDSLADVGSYAVGTVAALGGGKYTINGDGTATNAVLTGKNWTELTAAQFGLPAPCAAMTGLDGDASKGFSVPVKTNAGCFGYAQGGARVTNPVGPGNKLTGSAIGQLTVPFVTQIANHLAISGGKFSGTEVVMAIAGGNDALIGLATLSAGATAAGTAAGAAEGAKVGGTTFVTTLTQLLAATATNPATAAQAIGLAAGTEAARPGSTSTTIVGAAVAAAAVQPGNAAVASPAVYGPVVAKAQTAATDAGNAAGAAAGAKAGAEYFAANAPKLVAAMGQAGAEMGTAIKTQIVGKGANYVVAMNLGDFQGTPAGKAQSADVQALIGQMVTAFNTQLAGAIANDPKVLQVDLYSISHDQINNPEPYGLTKTNTPACGPNALGNSSIGCTTKNVNAGDVSHYMFADDIHPTPFEYSLIARYVLQQMITKGWL